MKLITFVVPYSTVHSIVSSLWPHFRLKFIPGYLMKWTSGGEIVWVGLRLIRKLGKG